jgi:hypothetical protein
MNGFRVMGRVFVSGTKQTAIRWFWWQAAREMTGSKRAGQATLRAFGALAIAWFGGGTLWALGVLWYVLAAVWFVAVGAFAEIEVGTDQALPSPTDAPLFEDEEPGQSVVVEKGRIGKAPVLRIDDPLNPARTHLVWLDPTTPGGEV